MGEEVMPGEVHPHQATPRRGLGWGRAIRLRGGCGAPPALLWTPSSCRRKTIPHKFSAHSENISCTTFLKYKNSRKQELALGTGLIG